MGKNDFNQQGLTVAYPNADGSGTVLEGGSHAWRNNNPGNIKEKIPRSHFKGYGSSLF